MDELKVENLKVKLFFEVNLKLTNCKFQNQEKINRLTIIIITHRQVQSRALHR